MIVSFLHVVFGEMVPKNISFSMPDRAALLLAPPLVGIGRAVQPIIVALNASANAVLRLFGVEPKDEAASTFTLDEVATIVNQSTREGVLTDRTGTLTAAFEFTEKKVRDVARRARRARLAAPHRRRRPTSSRPSPSTASPATWCRTPPASRPATCT